MTYFLLAIIILLLWCIYRPDIPFARRKYFGFNNKCKFCLWVSIILTTLLIIRNDYWGTDTQNYHALYNNIDDYLDIILPVETKRDYISSELGFFSLVHYINKHDLGFRTLISISAIFYVFTTSYLIYKYSENTLFSYFLFVTYNFWVFNTTMRQCFALTFVIWLVIFAIQKKFILYCIFIVLAVSFHVSAIVCLPLYFIINSKLTKFNIFLFFIIFCILLFVDKVQLFNMIGNLDKDYKEVAATTGYVRLAVMLIMFSMGYIYQYQMPKYCKYMTMIFLWGLILYPFVTLNPAFSRFNIYNYYFIIILAPSIVKAANINKIWLFILLVSYGCYNFTLGNKNAGVRVHPYVYYFEDYFVENPEASRDLIVE